MSMSKQNFLLNELADWQSALLDHLVDDGGTLQLRLLPGIARPLTSADGTFGGFTNPSGLAVDSQDSIYIVDSADHLIKRFDPCRQILFLRLGCGRRDEETEPEKIVEKNRAAHCVLNSRLHE